jgi:spore maturation protein CgeB
VIDKSILLLLYDHKFEDRNEPLIGHIKSRYLGAHQAFDLHFRQPLQGMFRQVIVYDYLRRRVEVGLRKVNDEIMQIVRADRPAYVVWTSFYYDIRPATFDRIRREGAVVIGWFFDDEWRFEDYSRWWAPHLDYVVTNAPEAVPWYKSTNTRCILAVPVMGSVVVPTSECASPEASEMYEVTFVGAKDYGDRTERIEGLRREGISVRAFGDGWGQFLSFERMLAVFRQSRININFSRCNDPGRRLQIKARVFEVCLAGGFLLTEYAPHIEDFFEIDREIVCFRDEKELVQKIRYYLAHEDERLAIADAGFQRAKAQYTTMRVMSRIFGEIERDTGRKAITPKTVPSRIPWAIRKIAADYHYYWGLSAFEIGNPSWLWRESFGEALRWNPFHELVWKQYLLRVLGRAKYGASRRVWRRLKPRQDGPLS